jgi:LmbE family N-acetylglucosaminyl deacetylase
MERNQTMSGTTDGKRILLLGVYGMEMVECGGVLHKNAMAGGVSHASILFAGPRMREGLEKAAAHLHCSIEYLGMDTGSISTSEEEKIALIRVIRKFRPDIIITQDTEHCISDLDPGRRPAMTLLLEAMALAGRDYARDKMPDLKPHRGFTVYYMTPEHPNCLVDIASSWEAKCQAMDVLESQLEFIAELAEGTETEKQYAQLIPGFDQMETRLERGRAIKRLMDQAYHLYFGSTGHNHVLLSENYRKDGMFVLEQLI